MGGMSRVRHVGCRERLGMNVVFRPLSFSSPEPLSRLTQKRGRPRDQKKRRALGTRMDLFLLDEKALNSNLSRKKYFSLTFFRYVERWMVVLTRIIFNSMTSSYAQLLNPFCWTQFQQFFEWVKKEH